MLTMKQLEWNVGERGALIQLLYIQ